MSRTAHIGDTGVIRNMHEALIHLRRHELDLIEQLTKVAGLALRQYEAYYEDLDKSAAEEVYEAKASLDRHAHRLAARLQSDRASGIEWLSHQAALLDEIVNSSGVMKDR